ncbi:MULTISPECIES: bifunctional helix-turn-helix domain-containing protein/methylated-DNA--[protein]-cysteine S-methyltransferase [unclassified Devosia]|jgi:AraC family transcriptional regulator of adaptative response/methylated-DNA-[protein]-cysteine methyltransferase|uniref:bifunctional helix-turn-helix domain-containing protein/methylated-DNA--[protein]-cysteine S-methyltransferase n=1 Tax=unclassified Devosia TaxID=196773 RepID=UPI0023D82684|nr:MULTISPECIES: bifunctional helix-turn-helix domain-containing protein/methylated-DNA--[protein]-cysteine S-methyltransferase [unclassified Devosia]WEJ33413.1 bifunctional helix-turn-helix domain-containing protein/methylated-DNA--[protein]-cysteine S-methyltransferase [Devosia sp. SD17-2]
MNQLGTLVPRDDYDIIRAAIRYLSETGPDATDLGAFARAMGLSERQLTELFRRWCGLSPKSFAQAVALDHAKSLLRGQASVLDTTYEVGLSSTSRLHDLFVAYEAMPPGVFRAGGAGLDMIWGVAPSPFGTAVMTATEYGVSGLGFADAETSVDEAFADLANRWPNARFVRDDLSIAPLVAQIFEPGRWSAEQPVRVVLIGTDFEVQVWDRLLKIPMGQATTYSSVAQSIGRPKASRAVGAAVGKNPISFVVPCHRVVGTSGALTGYHWGVPRKRAILGWEAGVISAAH